jgi:hypothetical protein
MATMPSLGNKEEEKKPNPAGRPTEDGFTVGGNVPNNVLVGKDIPNKGTTPVTPTGGNTEGKKDTDVILVSGNGTHSYSGNSSGSTGSNPVQTAEQKAETSLSDLMNRYSAELREDYNYSANKMKEERDAALRENYILQQQAKAALPEQMAAAGINGGARETSLADLIARYQGNRNDIQKEYMSSLGDLAQEHQNKQAENAKGYNDRWLEYLLSLAEMENQKKYGR